MERFVCNQTMFVSMERRNSVIDSALLRDVASAVYPNVSGAASGNDSEQIWRPGPRAPDVGDRQSPQNAAEKVWESSNSSKNMTGWW